MKSFINMFKRKDCKDIIFISYYTKNTVYKNVIEKYLLPSLKKFKLEYDIEEIENKGSWQKNTHVKAEFIKRKLLEYKKPVVFLDADAEIKQIPKLFFDLKNYDIGLHYLDWMLNWHRVSGNKMEALSGTLFLNYTEKTLEFLDKWIRLNSQNKQWEQKNMQQVLKSIENLKIYQLPYSYITIINRQGRVPKHMISPEDVVILHNQASRKYKKRNIILSPAERRRNMTKDKKEVFILGGGTSLGDYNLNWFKDKDTIAVNKTACYVKNLNHFITIDQSLFNKITKEEEEMLQKNAKEKVFIANFGTGVLYKNERGIIIDKRWNLHYDLSMFDKIIESQKIGGIGYAINDFRTGNNSGFCALQYAILLGYKNINLLGIDLVCSTEGTHFHGGYKQSLDKFKKNLEDYYSYWFKALSELKRTKPDIRIYSCSKISKLNDIIPYKGLK